MTSPLHQAQAEGLCLRYPETVGVQLDVSAEAAANILLKGIQMATTTPFVWQYIDKPSEGQIFLIMHPPNNPFPMDGIRFQDSEKRAVMPIGQRELELHEVKYGFIPGSGDSSAWRVRRRFRLLKGGVPQLVLVHYTRGAQTQINPAIMNQPVRNYPLRPVNEPAVYVLGDKAGTKVYPPGMAPSHSQGMPGGIPAMGMGMQPGGMGMPMPMPMNQQAMLAHQNSSMESLEQRRQREREQARRNAARPRVEDDDSADENDQISTRTLALTRYRRNHELMNEVLHHAAFGDKKSQPPPLSIFDKTELEEKNKKLESEIQQLQAAALERRTRHQQQSFPLEMSV